ncbi:hypothetical protein [Flavobacterium sp. NRK F7]|uniref:hypothetical protein n=1 Tax=Flavobacterium sp. NRK F7 TaxID=2954930 RepID=UPI0020907245|nr:hypothetical protein [Flavobacterium sp. NRK F7]MCO6162836.1 hypothetical protein [Flavobacterium sp. NRK F7]
MKLKHWIITLIIIFSGYNVINYIINKKQSKNWTANSEKILIEKCMIDSKNMAIEYPILTKEYCSCSMKKIRDSISLDEYLRISKMETEEQIKILIPIFKECLTEYQNRIKNLNK